MRDLTRRVVVGVRDDGAAHAEARCSRDCSEELAARYAPGRQTGLANDADRPTHHCECEKHHATAAPYRLTPKPKWRNSVPISMRASRPRLEPEGVLSCRSRAELPPSPSPRLSQPAASPSPRRRPKPATSMEAMASMKTMTSIMVGAGAT